MKSLYADKETRERLAKKSFIVYSSFTRWKKIAEKEVLSVDEVESIMDEWINEADKTEEIDSED